MSRMIDLTNQKFGRWTVLEHDKSKKGTAYWICQCECGTVKSVSGVSLRKGLSTSCGCYRTENSRINNGKYVDEIGNRYGKLVVIAKDEQLSNDKHRAQWICQCDCGNIITTSSKCLRDGKTKSCGCILSIGEANIQQILNQNNIKYKSQYGVSINNIWYRFDIAILENEKPIRLIEFDGEQHVGRVGGFFTKERVLDIVRRDNIKNQYALSHNIPLVRIPYWERDNITLEMILGNKYLITDDISHQVREVEKV